MRAGMALLFGLMAFSAFGADESWKLPLSEKEKALELNNVKRHNILGLYPSQVQVPFDDGPADVSTLGYNDVVHAVCWTSNYLAGASYRYAYLKKAQAPAEAVAEAKARADELFEAIYRCQLVTGERGLQARGYLIGHGEAYEERYAPRVGNNWYQGAGEYSNLRWRGSPSHHNYSDATHGLCQYYDLAAEGAQKDRCREAIDALVSRWVDNDFKIPHIDKKLSTDILGFTDGKTLNTRIMMAIAGATAAFHATGKEKFKAARDTLVERFHVRGLKEFRNEKDFDDAEHVFCHLENLFRIETDPELLAAYRVVLDQLWSEHKDDAQSLFTYIYIGATPNAPDRVKALKEALFSLQTWPTDTLFKPTMSSLRKDLKAPFPVYAAAWDNEYIWKGSLLHGDGWLSRTVTGMAVPAEDSQVLYAIDDKGDVYQSRDGASTWAGWRPINAGLSKPARKIAAGPRVRMIYVVCDDGFYASMSGGNVWSRLNVPEAGGKPIALYPDPSAEYTLDPKTPVTVFAVRESAAYRMDFKNNREFDRQWDRVTEVPECVARSAWGTFKPGDGGVHKSTDNGQTWSVKPQGLDIPLARAVFTPYNTSWVFAGTPAGLYISKDGGETWESGRLVLQFHHNERRDLGGAAFIDAYWRARYYGFIDDATANAAYPG